MGLWSAKRHQEHLASRIVLQFKTLFYCEHQFFPAGLNSPYPGIARIIWDTTGLIHPMPGLDSIGHGAFAHHRSSETAKEGTQ